MKVALAQMCSGVSPEDNAAVLSAHIEEAASRDADILFTPEMSGLLDRKRSRASAQIKREGDDVVLAAVKRKAIEQEIWVSLGSLALKSDASDSDKWVNRSFLISPDGEIVARYDKIHLFDVDLDTGESWRESSVYEGGLRAVAAPMLDIKLGMSVCYDLRFADIYTALTNAGAHILTVPSAFTVPTGQAHWEVLLRARAIESACFVVAAAQCGLHEDGRETYGHSMVVGPWGDVLLDMGTKIGVSTCEIDLSDISDARNSVPAVRNRRSFELPEGCE